MYKGQNEICVENGYQCLDINDIECVANTYVNPYQTGTCSYFCDEVNNPCNTGFQCNTEKNCTPTCITNEDCLKDKFTGNVCNSELNYCVEE